MLDPAEKFKAAEVQIPLYIYNVSKEVTERDVAEYVFEKTHVNIIPEKIRNSKTDKDYASFKFLIPRHKLTLFTNK